MKRTKWIVSVFLTVIFITPSILRAEQGNGVAQRVAALEAVVESLTTALDTANTEIANLQSELATANTAITNLQTELADVQNNSVLALDGILTFNVDASGYPRALFSGVNVQIVNGLGATNGYIDDPNTDDPTLTQVNGLGNLIVGYNEVSSPSGRSGSHNIVTGVQNTYTSFGGLVGGKENGITGTYASIIGGRNNRASGNFSTVSGGRINRATGELSSVTGGTHNYATGAFSSVSGGEENSASGTTSHVSGGYLNRAVGVVSNVSGGEGNYANGGLSNISGGRRNHADGAYSNVSGGRYNHAEGSHSSILGGQSQTTTIADETIPAIP